MKKEFDTTDEMTTNISKDPSNDPFDLSKLKLSQNFGDAMVKKAFLTAPVRKPGKQDFVRVHPSDDMRMLAAVIEIKDGGGETYVVAPEIASELPGEVVAKLLVTAVTRQGTLFVWPVKIPTEGDRQNHWTTSMLEAAEMAAKKWVRVSANMQLGAYEVFEATGNFPDPQWPDLDFQQIIRVAFKGRLIDSMEHPVIQQLLGRV